MKPADLLARHGIRPACLESAPAPPAYAQILSRVQSVPPGPCVVCGDQAATACIVVCAEAGPRWADLCWDHGMAVRPQCSLPETLEGIVSDLRAAARETGLPGAAGLASALRPRRPLPAAGTRNRDDCTCAARHRARHISPYMPRRPDRPVRCMPPAHAQVRRRCQLPTVRVLRRRGPRRLTLHRNRAAPGRSTLG